MRGLLALSALCAAPVWSDEVACEDAATTVEMTYCAGQSLEAADADLNAVYQQARAAMQDLDESGQALARPYEILLRDAQRAWISYRDQACSVEAAMAQGGTMHSILYLTCQERLTRARTEDLKFLLPL